MGGGFSTCSGGKAGLQAVVLMHRGRPQIGETSAKRKGRPGAASWPQCVQLYSGLAHPCSREDGEAGTIVVCLRSLRKI